ncbi:MAG TPA: hypothetical protein VGG49_13420 [Steroidobacteraceae bacterium]
MAKSKQPPLDPMGTAATPLTDFSPGTLAHMTPAQRGKQLKKSKRVAVTPAMLHTPPNLNLPQT